MVRYDIVVNPSNPSTADVIEAFAHAYDVWPKLLKLEVLANESGIEIELQLNQLSYAAGASGMFCVGGNLFVSGKVKGHVVGGFYDANTRGGYLKVTMDEDS